MFDGSLRIYPISSCKPISLSEFIICNNHPRSYPEKQHLKTPPLFRHFRAKFPYSPFRQFFQPIVGFESFPSPGTKETKSNPYVSFMISPPKGRLGQFKNPDTKYKELPFFLSFKISFQPWGSSKLKKYWNTFIIHHSVRRMWIG